eukprot:4091415-Prymnesium_polylepis.1
MRDDRASDACGHGPSIRQSTVRTGWPEQTLPPDQIRAQAAALSRENYQWAGDSDRGTAIETGPGPHDYGHAVVDRSLDRRFFTHQQALSL